MADLPPGSVRDRPASGRDRPDSDRNGNANSDLEIVGLHKAYGDVKALRGLDLQVSDGEFFVVFGPSASGKTTTLRSVAGLERPDAGRIHYAGQDVTDLPVQGRDMAMIFQTFALYPHLSIFDNLAYPLRESGLSRSEVARRVDETATQLRITHTLKRKPSTLSGGEQQRVAIGRALIRRPGLLLLDEPLTNLDAKLRHDTRTEFKRLHRELGMTMVYATPDQLEALSMGERIAVLRDGAVVQVGSPEELYSRPCNSYVATMIGAPPMNLVEGAVRDAMGGSGPVIALPFSELDAARWRDRGPGGELCGDVLFGIRPHDLAPARDGTTDPTFQAQVHLTEPLGDVTLLDLKAEGALLKMALPEDEALAYPLGTQLSVALSLDQAHLFDRATGLAL